MGAVIGVVLLHSPVTWPTTTRPGDTPGSAANCWGWATGSRSRRFAGSCAGRGWSAARRVDLTNALGIGQIYLADSVDLGSVTKAWPWLSRKVTIAACRLALNL